MSDTHTQSGLRFKVGDRVRIVGPVAGIDVPLSFVGRTGTVVPTDTDSAFVRLDVSNIAIYVPWSSLAAESDPRDTRIAELEACVREADADDGDRPRADDFVGLLDCLASDLKDHPGVPPSIRAWAPWIERRAAMVRLALVPDEGEKR